MMIRAVNCKTMLSVPLMLGAVLILGCGSMPRREAASQATRTLHAGEYISPDGKIVDKMGAYWLDKVKAFRADNEKQKPGGIVLVGDSITEGFAVEKMFAGMHVINRGISGDKIGGWKYYGVLDRLDESVSGLKPRKVFLLIGINDIVYWKTPRAEMERGYEQLLSRLKRRCKGCAVFVQSVLPVRGKFAQYNQPVVEFNEVIRRLAQKYGFTFLNIYADFCDANCEMRAELTCDGLHLSPAGYEEWRKILLALF
jgi:lysophospholipase L1-like esterase